MPTSQYARHALHCALGSTSSISHSSVFPAALITSCDSLLEGLNGRCYWRSLWSACRWGWFSIFWIKLWTLTPCDRVTVEFGTPGMLKSMFCSPRRLLGWTRCPRWIMQCHDVLQEHIVLSLCVCLRLISQVPLFHREHAWRECLQTISQVSPIYLKSQVLYANVFHRSRGNGTFFLLTTNTSSVWSGFPDRSQIGLGFGWVGWENVACWTSPQNFRTSFPTGCCSTAEPDWSFPLVQSWSCLNEIFGGGRRDTYDFSYKTSPVFNLTTFGIQ